MTKCDACKMGNTGLGGNCFFKAIVSAVFLVLSLTVPGCGTPDTAEVTRKKDTDKDASTLRMHLESNDLQGMGTSKIRVMREGSIELFVEKEPFLNEGDIVLARVIDAPAGGYAIAIQGTTHGQLVLQMASTSHRNRRIAIWSRWTDARWLAAPVISHPIEDGVFVFTPDCSREEADRIVRGINNVAIKLENQAKPGKMKKNKKGASVDDAAKQFLDK